MDLVKPFEFGSKFISNKGPKPLRKHQGFCTSKVVTENDQKIIGRLEFHQFISGNPCYLRDNKSLLITRTSLKVFAIKSQRQKENRLFNGKNDR